MPIKSMIGTIATKTFRRNMPQAIATMNVDIRNMNDVKCRYIKLNLVLRLVLKNFINEKVMNAKTTDPIKMASVSGWVIQACTQLARYCGFDMKTMLIFYFSHSS
jgi:hypothetical protein